MDLNCLSWTETENSRRIVKQLRSILIGEENCTHRTAEADNLCINDAIAVMKALEKEAQDYTHSYEFEIRPVVDGRMTAEPDVYCKLIVRIKK